MRQLYLVALLAGAAHAQAAAVDGHSVGPNIILILADDIGVETIGVYGSEIDTPGLNALAQEGVRFTNAHATPLCTPSRVRLLTGKYSFRNYRAFGHLDADESTLARELQAAGYVTGVAGKWQLSGGWLDGAAGATPQQAGFQESMVWHGSPNQPGCRYWSPTLRRGRQELNFPGAYGPDVVAEFARDFIQRNADAPFFLYYPMMLAHDPFLPTPDGGAVGSEGHNFREMMRYLDHVVDGLLDHLDALGIAENTLVLFIGDNGTHPSLEILRDGRPVRGGKGSTLGTGTHVPFIASWPGVLPAGDHFTGLIDLVDVYATARAAAGLPDQATDGFDLRPSLADATPWPRRSIFMDYAPSYWHLDATVYAFDARWKLYADGRLFDLATDPTESMPVSPRPMGSAAALAQAKLLEELASVDYVPVSTADSYFPEDFDPSAFDFDAAARERAELAASCAKAAESRP